MPPEWTVSLGESNEQLQEKFDISRERQDAFAYRSHRLARLAWADGFYDDLVVGVPDVDLARDEGIRDDTTLEKLARLKPSSRPDGTITAGNASALNDGASALLLGSEKTAEVIGGEPVARIAGRGAAALEPQMFGYAPWRLPRSRFDARGSPGVRLAASSSTKRSRCSPWHASTPGG